MNNFKQLQWPLIAGLGAFSFAMPLLNITGIMDFVGRPLGPLLAMTLISVAWLVVVVGLRVRQPVLTLTCTGMVYGLIAFVLGMIFAPILTGEWTSPAARVLVLPFAFMGIMLTNTLWGLTVGLIAWALQQTGRTTTDQVSQS